MTQNKRDIRRCAIQALYQFDQGRNDAPEDVRASLADAPGDDSTHEAGFDLALEAWATFKVADAAVAELTPEWPTHRQPALDRAILRLAYHEITSGCAPPKVAINEAVELAKEFSTEKSPMFINGVLDKLWRGIREVATMNEKEIVADADE